jgi:hypothetical protein
MLGLEYSSCSIILFEYLLPKSSPPHIPTICDAYAGDYERWNPHFMVAPPGSQYGFTDPPKDCLLRNGCPEVVHAKIQFKYLATPFKEIL